jgi:archaellum biogenesis ATPase FlaH
MDINQIPNLNEIENLIQDDQVVLMKDVAEKQTINALDFFPISLNSFNEGMNGGVTEGDLVILTGPTGMGKTSLAQTFTVGFNKIGLPQLWFSYEVAMWHLWSKFKSMGVNDDFLAYCPMKMTSGSVDWIEGKIKEGILKYKTKIVFIDHLGFLMPRVSGTNKDFSRNYSAYLGDTVRQLKGIAVENNIIIFLLTHVRKTKELGIDDIADSSKIAQEADFVFMVERLKSNSRALINGSGDVYSDETKIQLVKNRRTGLTKFVKCKMINSTFREIIPDDFITYN